MNNKLQNKIDKFLVDRKRSFGTNRPEVTRQEMKQLQDIIEMLIECKYEKDADGDLPIEFELTDRTRYCRSHYAQIAYEHKAKNEDEKLQILDDVTKLSRAVEAIQRKLAESQLPVQTFAPEPYDVVMPFVVVVRPIIEDDEYSACFPDANLEAQGANESEAVENLKALMLDMFDNLESKPSKNLGPGPLKQLAVLRKFIRIAV